MRPPTANQRRATLTEVATFLDNLTTALTHIDNELNHANPWPTQTNLAANTYTDNNGRTHTVGAIGGSRTNGTNSPVERKVIDTRARLEEDEWELWQFYNDIRGMALAGNRKALAATKRLIPGQEHRRCNSGRHLNLEGWEYWRYRERTWVTDDTKPEVVTLDDLMASMAEVEREAPCPNWPDDDPIIPGMCTDCLQRMNLWRLEHGYTAIVRDCQARTYLDAHNVRIDPNGRFARARDW